MATRRPEPDGALRRLTGMEPRESRRLPLLPCAVGVAIAVLTGCGSEAGEGAATGGGDGGRDLAGKTFVSTALDGAPRTLVRGSQVSLAFGDDGELTVRSGCNIMGGAVALDHGTLGLQGQLSMTEMACGPARMRQDVWVASFLGGDPDYAVDGDTLTLTGGDTSIILVDEEVAMPDASLTGTDWQLDEIVSGGDPDSAVSSVPSGLTSTLRLADGQIVLDLGCRVGNGPVTVGPDSFDVGDLLLSMPPCTEVQAQLESAVLGVLTGGSVDFVVDGEMLTLTRGDMTLVYRVSA